MSLAMAVFLRFHSKRKVDENKKFHFTTYEIEFFLTDSIDVLEWPNLFSERIIE